MLDERVVYRYDAVSDHKVFHRDIIFESIVFDDGHGEIVINVDNYVLFLAILAVCKSVAHSVFVQAENKTRRAFKRSASCAFAALHIVRHRRFDDLFLVRDLFTAILAGDYFCITAVRKAGRVYLVNYSRLGWDMNVDCFAANVANIVSVIILALSASRHIASANVAFRVLV